MASLAGKADPTLTKMAYAASMANVPDDYSKHYQSIVDQHKELMTDIETAATAYKLENDLATLEFKQAMKLFNDPLNVQTIDSDYKEMQTDITAQREEWKVNKGFKNDPEGRQDWDRRNQQIIGRHEQDNSNLATIQAGVEGNLYDIEHMEIPKKKYLTDLAKYQANQNKKSGKYNTDATKYMKDNPNASPEDLWKNLGAVEEGTVVKYKDPKTGEYTYISKIKTGEDTSEFISKKSSELLEYFNEDSRADDTLVKAKELLQNRLQKAKNMTLGYEGFKTTDKNALEEIISNDLLDNPNALNYMMNNKIGGEKQTFAEALRSGKDGIGLANEIILALDATNDDGDNMLEESDFVDPKNYSAVVDNILSGNAAYKDTDNKTQIVDTKDLYLEYTSKHAFETGHNQHKKIETVDKDKDKDKDKGGKYGGFGSYAFDTGGTATQESKQIKWGQAIKRRERLQGGLSFKGAHGDWKPTGDGNYTGEYGNLEQVYSAWDVADIESLWQSGESEETFSKSEKLEQEKKAKASGSAILGMIDNTAVTSSGNINDDDAAKALNKNFGLNKTEKHWFVPFEGKPGMGNYGFGLFDADDTSTNDIMLLENGEPYKEDGKIVRFKTGSEATQTDIEKINKILGYKIKRIKDTGGAAKFN